MRVLALVALTSLAFGCSGPSPAVSGDSAQRSLAPAETAQPRQPRFEEALLSLRVRRALLEHLKADALRLDVDVVGDSAVLSGSVKEPADRMLAEEIALAVQGVAEVHNKIDVEEASDTANGPIARGDGATERELGDAMLELRVQTRLVRELGEIAFRIEVEASDGVVSLRGPVPDRTCKELALTSAREVSGVHEVHDLLKIKE